MKPLALLVLLSTVTWAQSTNAQLTGTVTDSSGATVAGARIAAINSSTGVETEAISGEEGLYRIPILPPGSYRVEVRKDGFRALAQSGIVLTVNQTARVDFALQVGDVKEALAVTADAPLLQTDDSAVGGVIDNAKIINLPLNGRNPFSLAALQPGVQPQGGFFTPRVFQEPTLQANFTVNGSASMTNEIMIDGTSNIVAGHGQLALTPSIDAVQEFRLLTSTFSAEFGRTGGGVVNIVTKSGTNAIHGTLFEFLRNRNLDANNFFNNRSGIGRQPFVFNQYGGSVGGPVWLPRLYDGHNRTFFFFAYDGTKVRRSVNFIGTVPTAAQRAGDFSETRTAGGAAINIANPFSSRANPGGGFIRDLFPGNRVPANLMDPAAQRISTFYPAANLPGQPFSQVNNFIANASQVNDLAIWQGRLDHQINTKNRIYFRYSQDEQIDVPPNFYGNAATARSFGPGRQPDWHVTLNDTHILSPSTILEFRYGYARNGFDRRSESEGLDLTSIGFPASYNNAVQSRRFPEFGMAGMSPIGAFNFSRFFLGADTHMAVGQLTRIVGRHQVKAGADLRSLRHNSFSGGNNAGIFNFNPGFTQGPNPLVSGPASGFGFASFLLGAPAGATAVVRSAISYYTNYYAGYVQDDWRLSNRLTLNVGFRYDYETPRFERHNRLAYFDTNAVNPVGAQVGLPDLRGALGFVGIGGGPKGQSDPRYKNFAPRFGFAYNLRKDTVIRGGYGITYLPQGTARNCCGGGQDGFTTTTTAATTLDGGITPNHLLRDPFPNGLIQPSGSSLGPRTLIGQGIAGFVRDVPNGYSQQFNFNVQRQVAGILVEAAYVGSRGVNIPIAYALNQIPGDALALGNRLLEPVPNPFFGVITSGPNSGRTITRNRLLRPYPQFDGIGYPNLSGGNSTYHSLQLRVEKRFHRGLTLLGAYTKAKFISDVSSDKGFAGDIAAPIQDSNNRRLDRSLSPQDISDRLVLNYVYELPFQAGSPLARHIVNGWQLSGITSVQTGRPLIIANQTNNTASLGGGSRPNSTGQSARLDSGARSINRWFNTSVFTEPAPFTFGNVGRTLPDVREPGLVNFDFSVIKSTRIHELATLQFRAEVFNILNTPQFGGPGTTLGTGQFGVITSQANSPRQIQLGLKLIF
jgi:hypothetical protein